MENHDYGNGQFVVDDLLDFPNDDVLVCEGMIGESAGVQSGDSSTVVDSCNSSSLSDDVAGRAFSDGHFSSDLCVPYDDMAELEWLSNFEEESFSSEDLQNLQIISGIKQPPSHKEASQFQPYEDQKMFSSEVSVPGKARSKRSRIAPGDWTSRLLALNPASGSGNGKKTVKERKKDTSDEGRRCLHCATDQTPQWRTGPMGPKTLCNACGVRYKSGRLVPEYRPASSPTFVLTKHSNSHRKVMELRRQKDVHRAHQYQHQHQHQPQPFINHHSMMFDVSNGEDYLIHQHIGPDFRHLI